MHLKLTIKQKRFADEYIISGNASEAARKAGYSVKTCGVIGDENLKKPNVKAYISERLNKLDDKAIAKQEEVLKYLTSVMRGTSEAEIVVVESAGNSSEARRMMKAPDERERLKAAELLGKRYGLFTENLDLNVASKVVIVNDINDQA